MERLRERLVQDLAYEMRYAENYYLETSDDSKKWEIMNKVEKEHLSNKELKLFCDLCNSMGV